MTIVNHFFQRITSAWSITMSTAVNAINHPVVSGDGAVAAVIDDKASSGNLLPSKQLGALGVMLPDPKTPVAKTPVVKMPTSSNPRGSEVVEVPKDSMPSSSRLNLAHPATLVPVVMSLSVDDSTAKTMAEKLSISPTMSKVNVNSFEFNHSYSDLRSRLLNPSLSLFLTAETY